MTDFVWKLFMELRKELLEAQKIRAQMLGFKFTFISAGTGIIAANLDKFDKNIFIIPAFAAIFFDFIIYSYSFSIKRIGVYVREQIEPVLEKDENTPDNFIMWQQFLKQPKTRQYLAVYGNLGVTIVAAIIGVTGLFVDFKPLFSLPLALMLVVFIVMDIKAYLEPKKLGVWDEDNQSNKTENT